MRKKKKKKELIKGDVRAHFEKLEKKAGSQKALAQLLGVNARTIRKWKSRQRNISIRNYEKVKIVKKEAARWGRKQQSMYKIFAGSIKQFKARLELYNQLYLLKNSPASLRKLKRGSPELEKLIAWYRAHKLWN